MNYAESCTTVPFNYVWWSQIKDAASALNTVKSNLWFNIDLCQKLKMTRRGHLEILQPWYWEMFICDQQAARCRAWKINDWSFCFVGIQSDGDDFHLHSPISNLDVVAFIWFMVMFYNSWTDWSGKIVKVNISQIIMLVTVRRKPMCITSILCQEDKCSIAKNPDPS